MPALAKSRRAKAAPRKTASATVKPAARPRDAAEFAQQQVERLEAMLESLIAKADGGELGAIDRILKILDRLDRYQGFSPAAAPEEPEEDARERILRKLSEVDARRAAAKEDDSEAADDVSVGA
jgi:negative regulator of replication initiation